MVIAFTKTALPYGWLGNMAKFPVIWQGVEWRTTEALFQALRFAESDQDIREEIRSEKSPMGAKMAAKRHAERMVVEPTSEQDLANMDFCLRLKVEQHPELRDNLLATGEETIIEDVTNRPKGGRHMFWGMAFRDGEWVGENQLGKLWMKLRQELKEGRNANIVDTSTSPVPHNLHEVGSSS